MNSNATNKNRTGPKWVHTQDPEYKQQVPKTSQYSTPSLPMKATKDALELAVRCSLQAYNPLSPISATRSSRPTANHMPKSRSCNKWNKTKTTSHALPRPLTLKSHCPTALRRTKRECPSLSCRFNKQKLNTNLIEKCNRRM